MMFCSHCRVQLKSNQSKFCSNLCQSKFRHGEYIRLWQNKLVSGQRGLSTKNFSQHVVVYLFKKYLNSCSICKWNTVNIHTGKVPLEIDHIDGNSDNNEEENLRLLCPNCHSLTASYKGGNRGNGRVWRRNKYKTSRLSSVG